MKVEGVEGFREYRRETCVLDDHKAGVLGGQSHADPRGMTRVIFS